MRKHFTRWLLGWLMMMLMLVGSVTTLADNKDALDQAGVLSPKTQQEIKNLNQHQLGNVKTKPQLAVVTVKSLKGQDIDDVAQSYFDKYHFGRKGYDNGVLLLIAVKDHQVRMQTGYGVEGALPDLYIKKLMTPSVKDQLRNQDYDGAVMAMSQQIVGRLEKQEGKIRTQTKAQAEAEVKAKYDKKVNQESIGFIGYVLAIGLAIGACVYFGRKLGMRKDRMKKAYLDKQAKEEDDDSTPTGVDARQYVSRDHVYHDDDYDRDRYDRDCYDRDDDGMGDFVRGAVIGAAVDHMLHDHHDEEEHHHYDDDGDYLSHDSNNDWSSSNDDSGWDSSDDDWGSSDDSSWDSGSDWGSDDDFGGFGGDSGGGGGDDSW